MSTSDGTVIRALGGDDASEIIETESLCFNCHEMGVTRLLLTRIPTFREVIVSSFSCPHCGFENRTVDPAGTVQDRGKLFVLDVRSQRDLNRRVVQPSHSEIRIPSLDSSFPTSEGCVTTVEGAITTIINNLNELQPERKVADPKRAELIDEFIGKLKKLLTIETHFILELDDPSGNGFIENLQAPLEDPQLKCTKYLRTPEQNEKLGYQSEEQPEPEQEDTPNLKDTVSVFQVECPNCHSTCPTNMKIVNVPYFQEVILMAINCEFCGYRDSEVKPIAGIAEKGKAYRLLIADEADLSRDILKGDSATLAIPELDLQTQSGTLGSRFTTVEGVLGLMRDQLKNLNPFLFGDSADTSDSREKLATICTKLDEIISGKLRNIHLELSDPTGNSYLQSLADSGPDSRLEVTEFERTFEQNEELGLNDMKTENY
ncbi:nucleolar zinc-finger protein [Sparganum proliferum]